MKKKITRVVEYCDKCEKEAALYTCLCCGEMHCYECGVRHGVKYEHSIHFGGSGDGYYCKKCDTDLTMKATDPLHMAYRGIRSLRNELNGWSVDFDRRRKAAEEYLKSLQKS